MRIDRIRINDFRNIPSLDLHLCPGPNVIWGENGQGKTNLIEALWMCTGAKSFRGARDLQTVRFGCTQGSVESVFFAQEREQYLYLILDKKRVGLLNGVAMKSMNEMAGKLCAVVFSPAHLARLVTMAADGQINSSTGKKVLDELWKNGDRDPAAYVREHDLMQLSDPVLLQRLVDEAIARNPKAIADFKKGKTNALKSLVGQVMGKTGGRANPVIVQQLVDQKAAQS